MQKCLTEHIYQPLISKEENGESIPADPIRRDMKYRVSLH